MKWHFKAKEGRLNMLPIFAVIILLFGGAILAMWLQERNIYSRLQHEGKDIMAEIQEVAYYDYVPGSGLHRITYNIDDADEIELKVHYMVTDETYATTLRTTFSLQRNDHATLKDAIQQGQVPIRYLPSNPTQARFTVEFTDPNHNPYFGGR